LKSPEVQVRREKTHSQILVEDDIEGQEVALEGMLHQGQLKVLALFDKPNPMEGPFFEETLYVTPSRLDCDLQMKIQRCCEQAAAALGLFHGPIHAEARINSHGVDCRSSSCSIGGLARAHPIRTGISLEELIIARL
jgi:hypothetical protein